MDFTTYPYKYIYSTLSMSSGSFFSVNSIVRTSLTDANDFFFAGKAQRLTNETITLTFATGQGFIMSGKTNNSTQNCFSFSSGYSLSL